MLKLRKKDRLRLEAVLAKLERGHRYLMQEDMLLCKREKMATTTLHFTNRQGDCCYSLNKEIGSELCLLHTGIHELRKALEENPDG